ncbi:MAG: ABC-type transport auxiliary lipoprotein family protein [Halothiobacillus sp.]
MKNLLINPQVLRSWLGIGLMGLLLGGCSLPIKPQQAQNTYRLNPPALQTAAITVPGETRPTAYLIEMRPITAAQGFETPAMMYSREALMLLPYRDSHWLAAPAALLTDAVEQALGRQPWVAGVVSNSARAPVAVSVSCNLTRLEHDINGETGHAHLVMSCLWLTPTTRSVLAHWRFDQTQIMPENDAAQFAAASQELVNQALTQIVEKTRELLVAPRPVS